jgi:formate--tetrahydrofolate ligase
VRHIHEVASKINLEPNHLNLVGEHIAKFRSDSINQILARPARAKIALVTAITPTPSGEGKTTVAIGLSQALWQIGQPAIAALRQPSLGPIFGVKGGATGAGQSQALPRGKINLHFTGDFHAIASAHNLISAAIDNHLFHNLSPQLDPARIFWRRSMDMNDRALRKIEYQQSRTAAPRQSGFDITAASEIMAIICLADSVQDLKHRVGRIIVGISTSELPVRVSDLGITGAVAALLAEARLPNLVQTSEATPILMHGGPFANIAQGTCSTLSINIARRLCDFVVVEAGFAAELGAEKFIDLVSPSGGFAPDIAVLVATCKAIRHHGEVREEMSRKELDAAIMKGCENLGRHIEILQNFGLPICVAINGFDHDDARDIDLIREFCTTRRVDCEVVRVYQEGGKGAVSLAQKLIALPCNRELKRLYSPKQSITEKIRAVAIAAYGAKDVNFGEKAQADLVRIQQLGLNDLPICIAKTSASISDDPKLSGAPSGFVLNVSEIRISAGAGFVIPVCGSINLMPGLPKQPLALDFDLLDDGTVIGI